MMEKMAIMTWACNGHAVYHPDFTYLTYAKGEDYFSRTGINTVLLMVFPPDVGWPYATNDIPQIQENVDHWVALGYKVIVAPYMPNIGPYDLTKIRNILVGYLDNISDIAGLGPTGLGVRGTGDIGASPTPEENHEWLQMMADECNSRGKICLISNGDWQSNIDVRLVSSFGVIIWAPYTGMWRPGAWDFQSGVAPECWVGTEAPPYEINWYTKIWQVSKYPNWDNIKAIIWWTTLTKYFVSEAQISDINKCTRDYLDIEPYPDQPVYPPAFQTLTDNFDYPDGSVPAWLININGSSVVNAGSLRVNGAYHAASLENVDRGPVSISCLAQARNDGFLGLIAWFDDSSGEQRGIFFEWVRNNLSLHVGKYHWSYDHVASVIMPFTHDVSVPLRMDVTISGVYPRDLVTVKVYAAPNMTQPYELILEYAGSAMGLHGGKSGFHARDAKGFLVDRLDVESLAYQPPIPPPTPTWEIAEGSWLVDGTKLVGIANPNQSTRIGRIGEEWTDSTIEATITISDQGAKTAGIFFRYKDPNNYYYFRHGAHDGLFMLYKMVNGVFSSLGDLPRTLTPEPHLFRIVVSAWQVQCYVDGTLIFDNPLTGQEIASGGIGFEVWDGCNASFEDITVNGAAISHPVFPPLQIGSTPLLGIPFSLSNMPFVTPATLGLSGPLPLAMPSNVDLAGQTYNFVEYENGSTNPIRQVTGDMNISAAYELVVPPPAKGFIQVHAFADSQPITAQGSILETAQTFQTPAAIEVDPGTYTVEVLYPPSPPYRQTVNVAEGQTIRVDAFFTMPISLLPLVTFTIGIALSLGSL